MSDSCELGDAGFYRAFEDRYRGSRELITDRLSAYLPFVKPLLEIYPAARAVDLGCGRGEWLEVLSAAGFKPVGVDLDPGMLRDCHQLGLDVVQGEGIAYLSALPGESQAVVSAFHVVEHISFDCLRSLVAEAMRVLVPGGLLIMETPNPENLIVATRNFYLDPTHQRPIPPDLLAFVPEYYGYGRVKVLRLQEPPGILASEGLTLNDVFSGASPDYAVVAQKQGDEHLFKALDACFDQEFGVSLEALSSHYDSRIATMLQRSESLAQTAEARVQQGLTWLAEARRDYASAVERNAVQLAELHRQYSVRVQAAEDVAVARTKAEMLAAQIAVEQNRTAQIEAEIQQIRAAEVRTREQLQLAREQAAIAGARAQAEAELLSVQVGRAQDRIVELEGQCQRWQERFAERAAESHASLLASEVRLAQSEARVSSLTAQTLSLSEALEEQRILREAAESGYQVLSRRIDEERVSAHARELELLAGRDDAEQRCAQLARQVAQRDSKCDELQQQLSAASDANHRHWMLCREQENALELANEHCRKLEAELKSVHGANHHHWQLSEALERQLLAMHQSTSWRVTAPMRVVGTLLRKPPKWREIARDPIGHSMRYVLARPRLKRFAEQVLSPFPSVDARIKARRAAQIQDDRRVAAYRNSNSPPSVSSSSPISVDVIPNGEPALDPMTISITDAQRRLAQTLSPRGREIFFDLIVARGRARKAGR
ncbi:methyltransferase domain-containing protein [Niveibacterium sp. COAC-50]|uniref:methyltransferase domain-containing protein n=1 Tax=Niveibacterium sp. COAC-50 TaxID=2729384 RepID=UPI0020A670E4|nr:methyltransferase domain-containing protein [Niveibacterium sp. COAC-50]